MTGEVAKIKSAKILDEVKRRKNQKEIIRVEEEKIKVVIFTLLQHHFAFLGSDIKEILPVAKINFVPGSPSHILGVINVRGDVESVLNITTLLGLEDQEKKKGQRIVIAEKNDIRSGILVDSVEDVLDIPKSSINNKIVTLNEAMKNLVTGQINYGTHCTAILDVGKLFAKMLTG